MSDDEDRCVEDIPHEEAAAPAERPQAPKVVKFGGRKRGSKNKTIPIVKQLASQYGEEAIYALVILMRTAENEDTKIKAIKELLDRGYGKAAGALALSGADGGPLDLRLLTADTLAELSLEQLNAIATRFTDILSANEAAKRSHLRTVS